MKRLVLIKMTKNINDNIKIIFILCWRFKMCIWCFIIIKCVVIRPRDEVKILLFPNK